MQGDLVKFSACLRTRGYLSEDHYSSLIYVKFIMKEKEKRNQVHYTGLCNSYVSDVPRMFSYLLWPSVVTELPGYTCS